MKYIVKAPVEDYSGEVAGVHLVKGSYTGELTPAALAYFQGAGYEVEKAGAASKLPKESADGETPTRSSSKADWVKYAVNHSDESKRMTEAEAEGVTRDQLAEKFLGPKSE